MSEWVEISGVVVLWVLGVLFSIRLNAADDRAERKEARDRRIHVLERKVGLHDE